MAETTETNTMFYYKISEILTRVRNRTMHRVKNLTDSQGRPLFDDLAMMTSDEPTFNTIAPKAAARIFKKLRNLSSGITGAYSYNGPVEVESLNLNAEDGYIVFTVEFPTYWDPNQNESLDIWLLEGLVSYILKSWWGLSGAPELAHEENDRLEEIETEITSCVLVRTNGPSRPYKII